MAPSKVARLKKEEKHAKTQEHLVKKKFYKSKQEQTYESMTQDWNIMFNRYYDHMEYCQFRPSINIPEQRELALWVNEQEENYKNVNLGYINIMSDKSIYNTWKDHRPT